MALTVLGAARLGSARQGTVGHGTVGHGGARHGKVALVLMAWRGSAGRGEA